MGKVLFGQCWLFVFQCFFSVCLVVCGTHFAPFLHAMHDAL